MTKRGSENFLYTSVEEAIDSLAQGTYGVLEDCVLIFPDAPRMVESAIEYLQGRGVIGKSGRRVFMNGGDTHRPVFPLPNPEHVDLRISSEHANGLINRMRELYPKGSFTTE